VGATPQELKQEIDLTRADLAANVDALAEKVTPAPATRKAAGIGALAAVLLALGLKIRRARARRSDRSR
jgi:hypothetical protein